MINKDKFKQLIKDYQEYDKRLDALYRILGFGVHDNPFTEAYWKVYNELWAAYFDADGCDTILWWLLEKSENPDLKMWKDGDEIPTETVDDLWNIVESNRI